jgi:membrane-bound serine protease (ClpP class)
MDRMLMRRLACIVAALAATAVVAPGQTTATVPATRAGVPGAGKALLPEGVKSAGDVYVIPIREAITGTLYDVLKYKVIKCRAAGARLVVFDMDTFGGEVQAAWNIVNLIRSDMAKTPTICYVRHKAISAGAMIALACRRIVMSDNSELGDCAPITLEGKLEGIEREKIETALRAKFRNLAEANGYSTALAQSMVSAGLEVWKLRHKTTGQIRYALPEDENGKVDIPLGRAKGDSNPESLWEVVEVTVPAGKLLTMTQSQAAEMGFAAGIVAPDPDRPMANLMSFLGLAGEPVYVHDNLVTGLALFLTHPVVTGLLMMGLIFFGYVEMHTPGFGLFGTLALVCLGLLVGGHFVVGLANYWEVLLILVGLALIGVEIFVIPGFGVAGVSGALCCLVGLIAILIPNAPGELPVPTTELDWSFLSRGLVALGSGFVAALVAAAFLMRHFEKVPLANKLLLPEAAAVSDIPAPEDSPIQRIREGELGTVTGMCRPVGTVRFGNDLVDAMTEGEPLEPGTKVRVIRREGNRLVVEKV